MGILSENGHKLCDGEPYSQQAEAVISVHDMSYKTTLMWRALSVLVHLGCYNKNTIN